MATRKLSFIEFAIIMILGAIFLNAAPAMGWIPGPGDDKTFTIRDDINIQYVNSHNYSVFFNESYAGEYPPNIPFFYPNNSKVHIDSIESLNTNYGDSYQIGKVFLYVAVMYLLGAFFVIGLIYILYRKLTK